MVFSSLVFLFLFLPLLIISYLIFSYKKKIHIMNLVLLVFSLIFIFWGSGKDIIVLITIIVVNFFCGLFIFKSTNQFTRKLFLIFSITVSIGMLFFFKYSLFFAQNAFYVLDWLNITWDIPEQINSIILPLGISFYTFQALSYTIDVYYNKVEETKNFIDFSLYVSFFPQLIAGPIVRYRDINEQIKDRHTNYNRIYSGTVRFVMGLAKKVLLANTVATAADSIFGLEMSQIDTPLAWLGILAYSLQIFLDFSAYSDMAIGLARIFGFELLENFNFPYIATTVQDFWRRWHISLSSWIRDYLYIPLGGNRKGKARTYLNLLITFFLCGLWHGANWTFIVWGLWHGVFLILERTKIGVVMRKVPKSFRRIYVLVQVAIGWAIFRSDTLTFALRYIKRLFVPTKAYGELKIIPSEFYQNDVVILTIISVLSSVGVFVIIKNYCQRKKGLYLIAFQFSLLLVFIITIMKLYTGGYNPFIYFRF